MTGLPASRGIQAHRLLATFTITITSATKAYNIPGLRCGLMHFGSSALRERFRYAIPDRMLGIVSPFGMEATIVAWRECNHLAPVFEEDRLSTVLTIEGAHALEHAAGAGLVDLRAQVTAERDGADGGQAVLDWRLLALIA